MIVPTNDERKAIKPSIGECNVIPSRMRHPEKVFPTNKTCENPFNEAEISEEILSRKLVFGLVSSNWASPFFDMFI